MIDREDHQKIEAELAHAEAARRDGFEGRARVCARRAAGIAIRAYTRMHRIELPHTSAFDLLNALEQLPGIPEEARQAALLLTERVDTEFSLPADIDLISETRRLTAALEKETIPKDQQR
jgi:HEPN domain-containing protein